MNETLDYLYMFFSERCELPGSTRAQQLSADFFQAGVLDSLGLVELVVGIEDRFHCVFTPEQLEDPRFHTINGLAEMIHEQNSRSIA